MLPTFLPSSCRGLRCRMVTSCPAFTSSFTKVRPMNSVPPITRIFLLAGSWRLAPSVVILQPKVRNQVLSLHPTQGVFQLHQLDENVMLGIKSGRGHGSLEVKGQPLLDAL